MLPPTMKGKARRREGKENAFGDRDWISFSSKTKTRMAYGASYLKGTGFFESGGMIAGPSPRSARWPIR